MEYGAFTFSTLTFLNNLSKLISYKPVQKRKPNALKGKVKFFEDFDSSNQEIEKLFEE